MKYLVTLVLLAISLVTASAADTLFVHPNAEPGGDGQSWNSPFRTMTIAMATAKDGDELWIARGTFTFGAPLTMKNGVRIYGGFNGIETLRERRDWYRNPTIFAAGQGVTSLLTMDNLDSTSRVDGLVLQGATESAVVVTGGAPVFFNCLFRDNSGVNGGAIYGVGVTRVRMEFCTFTRNTASQAGGAVYFGKITTDPNYAYGPFFGECLFDHNTAYFGGGVAMDSCASMPQIASCVFSSNTANVGGGLGTRRVYAYITNTTFIRNTQTNASGQGGRSAYMNGGFVQNSIFWNGVEADTTRHLIDGDLGEGDTTTLKTSACLVERDFDLGFWQSDPQFENIENVYGSDGFFGTDDDGLRLSSFSPVRDGGVIDGFVNHQNCDAIGNPRLVGRKNDLGAYEAQRAGRMGYREVMAEARTGKLVLIFRHAKTDWGSKDPGPSPECFPGRNLIFEGREQSREIGKHYTSLGVSIGDAFSSPVCRCWETVDLMVGRYEKKQHWASGGSAEVMAARELDMETIPTNGNRLISTHDAVFNLVFNPAGDGTILTTAEIMEGDNLALRPTGDTSEVLAQWCSDTWERYYVRFPEVTSADDPCYAQPLDKIAVMPLPATDQLTIASVRNEAVRIMDVMGRVVAEVPADVNRTIDVSTWTPGTYHVVGLLSGQSAMVLIAR